MTGANTGIGYEIASLCIQQGAQRVGLACRSVTKADEARERLRRDTARPCEIVSIALDLASTKSVLDCAESLIETVRTIDVLVLNAGINSDHYDTDEDGHEISMRVNFYSNALLVFKLLPALIEASTARGAPSRITLVGSRMQGRHSLDQYPLQDNEGFVEHFDDPARYIHTKRYGDSKLMATAWIAHLAEKIPANKVLINVASPGMVGGTSLNSSQPMWFRALARLLVLTQGHSIQEGAEWIVSAFTTCGADTHGKFVVKGQKIE